MSQSSPESETLADEFTKWVEQYAAKVCPPGCLPTRGQEREINLFARIAIALHGHAQRPAGCGDPNCKDPNCTYGKGKPRCQSCGDPIAHGIYCGACRSPDSSPIREAGK